MQVFRLVRPGVVDKVIAFDELPKDLVKNVRVRPSAGLPRYWDKFVKEFYILEYRDLNRDIEMWSKIESYVRRSVDPKIRLMDRIADMAKPMASNSKEALSLEPEDIPIIPLPKEKEASKPVSTEVQPTVKKAGRPKKKVEVQA